MKKIAYTSALLSFSIGSLLLIIYFVSMSTDILIFSYNSLCIIGLGNLLVLAIILYSFFKKRVDKIDTIKGIGILVINIPIAIIYFYFVIYLTNTIRITFTNNSGSNLENLKITGCNYKVIKSLDKNDCKTLWINIENDCSINLEYKLNGIDKKEIVVGYATPLMGQKINYSIGSNKTIIL